MSKINKLAVIMFFGGICAFAIQNHPTDLVISRIESTPVVYPIRFVFFGDSRNSFSPTDPSADSIFAIERAQIDSLHPVFVVHGGDFRKDGYTDEYMDFIARIDSFQTNMVTVRGNHELYADEGPAMYDSIFGETDYYFDYGIYRFIILADCQQDSDTSWYGHYIDYLVSEEQLNWLDSILEDADSLGMFEFVFAHVPPYNAEHDTEYCLGYFGYEPSPNYELSHTEEFSTILSLHNVVAGCWSHQHFYDRSTYMGVPYIISGGAGAPLDSAISPVPYGGGIYHFILFELDSLGNVTGYIYRAGEYSPDSEYTFYITPSKIVENNGANSNEDIRVNNNFIVYSEKNDIYSIDITDILGRIVYYKKAYSIHSGKNILNINLYNMKNGIYFVNLHNDRVSIRKKIIYIR